MKRALILVYLFLLAFSAHGQQQDVTAGKVDLSYFVTKDREELIEKLIDLPCGISAGDPVRQSCESSGSQKCYARWLRYRICLD